MTKPHKHKDLIIAWANGETIQCWNNDLQVWVELCHPNFNNDVEFRVKPRTISINGIEVPAPEQQALDAGTVYYSPYLLHEDLFEAFYWRDDDVDKRTLSRGLVHLTKEAAVRHAKALLSFTSK